MKHKIFYSVWIGGIEINDYPLTHAQAVQIAQQYKQDGYEDVAIQTI